jgi:uncharacterized protein YjbJ (UPF0337 family)
MEKAELIICYAPNGIAGATGLQYPYTAIFSRRYIMNDDQIKGKAKDIGGKVQEEFGKAIGSSEQEGKGLSKQIEGKVQEKVGDAKDIIGVGKGNR